MMVSIMINRKDYKTQFLKERNNAVNLMSFRGIVTDMNDFMMGQNGESEGCFKQITVEDVNNGIVNFQKDSFGKDTKSIFSFIM